jgi:abortive infection bacteriophage resistance protein
MNLKAKTRKQIAQEYGIREKTLRGWLKKKNRIA